MNRKNMFWPLILAIFLTFSIKLSAGKNHFERDYFGFPKINIDYLDWENKNSRRIIIPNGQFKEKTQEGRIKGWMYDMSYNKTARISTDLLSDGKEVLKLEDRAIIYTPQVEVNYKNEYKISFSYLVKGEGNGCIRLNYHDRMGKIIETLFRNLGNLKETGKDFKRFAHVFTVSSQVKSVSFTFSSPANGSFSISGLNLDEILTEPFIDAKVYPWSFVDGRFALIQGEMVPMCISLANPQELKPGNPRLIMELPQGIKVIDGIYGMPDPKIIKTANDINVWSIPIPPMVLFNKIHKYSPFFRIGLFTELPPSVKSIPILFYYKDNTISQTKQRLDLIVLPPLPQVSKLKLYKFGASLATPDMCFDGPALNLWADLYAGTGFNTITIMEHMMVSKPNADRKTDNFYRAFHKQGIYVFQEPFMGGYVLDLGYWLCRPLDNKVCMTMPDGSKTPKATCTSWLITNPLFKNKLYNRFKKLAVTKKSCDAFAFNWEPWPYLERGCFCDTCIENFVKFLGKDKSYLKKSGKKEILIKHRNEWFAFRNKQLGELMKTIYSVLGKLEQKTGHHLDLMPYVTGRLGAGDGLDENYPGDIGKYARIISPFLYPGRHFFLYNNYPKSYRCKFSDDFPLNIHRMENYREWTVQQNPENPPKLYMLRTFDMSESILYPSQLRLMALLDIMYGCHGTLYYRFQGGYDGRFYHTFANICNDLVKLEPYFLEEPLNNCPEGIKTEGFPYQQILKIKEGKWQPDFINGWMVQNNSRRIISIANVQEKWEAVVNWKLTGIPDGNWTLYDPLKNVYLAINNNPVFTSDNLKHGIYQKLMPNEIQFWVIEKTNKEIGDVKFFTPQITEQSFIQTKMIWEQKQTFLKKENAIKVEKKKGFNLDIQPQENDTFKIYAVDIDNNGEQELILETKFQKLAISVAHSAKIISWTVKGKEMVNPDCPEGPGGLLTDKLWETFKDEKINWKRFYNLPYKTGKIVLDNKNLSVEFDTAFMPLPLILHKKICLSENLPNGFKAEFRIKNNSNRKMFFSFWCHNRPALLVKSNFNDVKWHLPTSEGKIIDETFWRQSFYPFANLTDADLHLFDGDTGQLSDFIKQKTITGNWTILYSHSQKTGLKIILNPEKIAYYYYFDRMKAAYCTLEWIYRRTGLNPGKEWHTTVQMSMIKNLNN